MRKFLLPLVVLLVAGIISATLYFTLTAKYKSWQTTDGTITNVKIFNGNPPPKAVGTPKIRYEWIYTVDGVEYFGTDIYGYSKGQGHHNIGDTTEIWYNPNNPAETSFSKPSLNLEVCIPFIFAIPIMLAVYDMQARKEDKKLLW